jgi:molecular chaperone DnaK (HSP70)
MKLAFILGCGKYNDPDIAPLSYAGSDASKFAEIICLNCGLAAEEIRLLTTDNENSKLQPTKSNILRELSRGRSATTSATSLEQIFFFFSGHGFHSQIDGEDYLVPQDAVYTALEETAIPFNSIVKHLKSWSSAPIILFIDACRAVVEGGKNIVVDGLSKINVEALHAYGMASFASCSPHQRSYEAEGLMSGIFTYSLVEALSDTGKCKTIYELDSYLSERSPQLSKQYDKPIQIPFTRVEPLNIQDTVLVSEEIANKWKAQTPVGREIRKKKVSPAVNLSIGANAIYAIDFGTSYSSISVLTTENEIIPILSSQRRSLVPSVVSFLPNLDYLVGIDAVENARLRPESTIFGIKRLLGYGKFINVEGHALSPEFIASLIIKSLKKNAEDYLSSKVEKAIAAVPANFNIAQCNALAKAFELANLTLFRFIGEPCASSVLLANHELLNSKDEWLHFLVLDLGGGTFDVSFMQYSMGISETLGIAGDNNLGGIDYDVALQQYIHSEIERVYANRNITLNDFDQFQIKAEAERAKIALGSSDKTNVILQDIEVEDGKLINIEIPITREIFRMVTTDLNHRVKFCIEEAIKQAHNNIHTSHRDKIDAIVLAGQGMKVFTVRDILEEMFSDVPVISDYQENAVVTGMCKYSGVFSGYEANLLLVDSNYTAIGISCPDIKKIQGEIGSSHFVADDKWIFEALPLNTTIPTFKSFEVLFKDNDGKIILELLEITSTREGKEYSKIGQIIIEAEESITWLYVFIDVDANRTTAVSIANPLNHEVYEYQINNFFTKTSTGLQARASGILRGPGHSDLRSPDLSNYEFKPIQKLS